MNVASNPTLVADYLSGLPNLLINREYQRGGGIWPPRAKSALIETIVLGFPMPAMYIHQKYNAETKKPYKELVDGQQRTEALRDFQDGKLRLSGSDLTPRLRGRTIGTLDPDDYERFMSYSLPIFVFTNSSDKDVREAFRRLNSFNAILTPEETRHSTYHGPFKWFIHTLAGKTSEYLIRWETFTLAQVNRMKDTALIAELIYAYLNGLKTTKAKQLDLMYQKHEKLEDFGEAGLQERVEGAFRLLGEFDWFASSPLTKPYQLYLLILAIMHARKAIPTLNDVATGGTLLLPEPQIRSNLGELIEALESGSEEVDEGDDDTSSDDGTAAGAKHDDVLPEDPLDVRLSAHSAFVAASRQKTNTVDTRKIRFGTFMSAVARQ